MDANGTLDEVKKNAESSGKLSYSNDGVDTNIMENFTPKDLNQYNNVQPQDFHINKSKLPVEILESFKTKQIDTTLLNGGMTKSNGSVLDQLDMLTNGKVLQQEVKQQPQQQIIKETVQVQPQIASTVDYSMIKMIVEDCMRKYTSSLKKQLICNRKVPYQSLDKALSFHLLCNSYLLPLNLLAIFLKKPTFSCFCSRPPLAPFTSIM